MQGSLKSYFGVKFSSVQGSNWHEGAPAFPNIYQWRLQQQRCQSAIAEHTSRGLRLCPVTVKVLVSLQTSSPAPSMKPASGFSLESWRGEGAEHSHGDPQKVSARTSAGSQHGASHTFRTPSESVPQLQKDLMNKAEGVGTMQQSIRGGGLCAGTFVLSDAEVRAHLRSWWQTRRCQIPCAHRWLCADQAAVACCSTKPPKPTLPAVVSPCSPTVLRPRPVPPVHQFASVIGPPDFSKGAPCREFSSSVPIACARVFQRDQGRLQSCTRDRPGTEPGLGVCLEIFHANLAFRTNNTFPPHRVHKQSCLLDRLQCR